MRALRRFIQDQRGTISVEFILWVPFLGLWLTVSVALYDAWMSRNQAAKVTHTLADILSRQEVVQPQFLFQIDALQAALLTRASGAAKVRISSVQETSDGPVVLWSCTNSANMRAMVPDKIPDRLLPQMETLENVITVEVSVPWSRSAGIAGLDDMRWEFSVATRPRFTPQMQLAGACP